MDSKLWSDFKSNFASSQYWHLEIVFSLPYRMQGRDRNTTRFSFHSAAVAAHSLITRWKSLLLLWRGHEVPQGNTVKLPRLACAARQIGKVHNIRCQLHVGVQELQLCSPTDGTTNMCNAGKQLKALITQVGKLHRSWGKGWEESHGKNNKKVNRNRKQNKNLASTSMADTNLFVINLNC